MPDLSSAGKSHLRLLGPLVGLALLLWLVTRMNHSALIAGVRAIGWGFLLILALGGAAHIVKTCAWRLTLQREARKVSFSRMFGLRLASEAIGQFGVVGLVTGEATRISLLGSGVSLAGGISSVMLDRLLFILTGAVVIFAGALSALLRPWLPHGLRISIALLTMGAFSALVVSAIAVRKGWPVLSGTVRAAAQFSPIRKWLKSKETTLLNAEQQILRFHHDAPAAFWGSLFLNCLCHFLAILEVYFIVRLLGGRATLLSALFLESLTKLINILGAVNPGNVGTYEGGNMAIGKLVHLTAPQGLVLALCRRMRAVFWAIIGALCLAWLTRSKNSTRAGLRGQVSPSEPASSPDSPTFLILAHDLSPNSFEPALATVATLPVILRAILGVANKNRARVIVALNLVTGPRIRYEILRSGRVPAGVEWIEVPVGTTIPSILQIARLTRGPVALIWGSRTYHPDLLRRLQEWDEEAGTIEFVHSGEPIGLFALTHQTSAALATDSHSTISTDKDLHGWIVSQVSRSASPGLSRREVSDDAWQRIADQADVASAERKLDRWLIKATDGIFARMNRRVSIPISRRLINFPISPNMVSLFTLGVSFAAGAFFAFGGYRNSLIGALLSAWASILDGCDGEVARLKLQVSALGCWLDSICDYLYYFVVFGGMIIGVARGDRSHHLVAWGTALIAGAVMTFITASAGRKRLSHDRPEKYLERWHKNAESRSAGLLLNMGRYTEFIVRRCFLPWMILVFALLNLTRVIVYLAAFGANVAWIISLRSLIEFPSEKSRTAPRTVQILSPVSVSIKSSQPLRRLRIAEDDGA